MKIDIYRLKEDKDMTDENTITSDENLFILKEEDDMCFVETIDNVENKKIFWVKKDEIALFSSIEKEFTEKEKKEIDLIINGNFLTLI